MALLAPIATIHSGTAMAVWRTPTLRSTCGLATWGGDLGEESRGTLRRAGRRSGGGRDGT